MANIPLKSIKFPDLADTYTVPSNAGELPYNKSATYPDDTVGKALQDKPDADGTIANAEQLHSTVGVTDTEPFSFRTSGGSLNIGDREELTLVGVDVGWNQLVPITTKVSGTQSDVDYTNNGDGSFTLNGTCTADADVYLGASSQFNVVADHIYMLPSDRYWTGYSNKMVFKNTYNVSAFGIYLKLKNGVTYNNERVWIQAVDLTAFLGSTIAEYILSIEQSTAGSGVAFFTKYFGTGYKAFDSGSLQSPVVKGIKMTGFNAYNHGDGTAKLVGGCLYQITGAYSNLSYSTGETITPDANGKFTPTESGTLTVTGGNGTTTCVHLVWDGERDGQYEPYTEHTYDIEPKTLHGIMKQADGKLYADGDTYEADGAITRRYGSVNMGSIPWSYNSTYGLFYGAIADKKNDASNGGINPKYPFINDNASSIANADGKLTSDKTAVLSNGTSTPYIYVRDSAYSDADVFKTAMNGAYLVYEIATQTTETAYPFASPMIVDDWGTEEFLYNDGTTKFAPVGHSTKYLPNLKAKLEMAPDSPNGDGDYIVQQENGINTYIPLASTDTITSIIARLEALEG